MRRLGTLTLTHSSRRTNLDRCSRPFLEERFGDPGRLRHPPPFTALPPARQLYSGGLSFFRVVEADAGQIQLHPLGGVRRRERIQHAAFAGDRDLLVGFEHHLERWQLRRPLADLATLGARDFLVAGRCEHPHLAGLHTVAPLPGGGAALACSAPDAILFVDAGAAAVCRELPLPSGAFARAYELTEDMDLRRHYIPDELQAAHLNAAFPDAAGRRLAVSTFIQGAVGIVDLATGAYEELARGLVGCHGARFDDDGRVYFADSTAGALVVLDGAGAGGEDLAAAGGGDLATVGGSDFAGAGASYVAVACSRDASAAASRRRFAIDSLWLHDVQHIEGDLYAFALADRNELRIYDVAREQLLCRHRFATWPVEVGFALARRWPGWLGNSVQSLGWRAA
jgi:hypothetical protein